LELLGEEWDATPKITEETVKKPLMRKMIFAEQSSVQPLFGKIIHQVGFCVLCYVHNYSSESLHIFQCYTNSFVLHRKCW